MGARAIASLSGRGRGRDMDTDTEIHKESLIPCPSSQRGRGVTVVVSIIGRDPSHFKSVASNLRLAIQVLSHLSTVGRRVSLPARAEIPSPNQVRPGSGAVSKSAAVRRPESRAHPLRVVRSFAAGFFKFGRFFELLPVGACSAGSDGAIFLAPS